MKGRPRKTVHNPRELDAFLEMLTAERGASANTLEAYRRDLADFAAFLGRLDKTLGVAGSDDVRAYMAAAARAKLSSGTVARRLSALRQFHRFLYVEGRRPEDPAAVIEGPRRGRPPDASPSGKTNLCAGGGSRGATAPGSQLATNVNIVKKQ